MPNKYNLSNSQVAMAISKISDRLPDDFINNVLIKALEELVPEVMSNIEKYKDVPLEIDKSRVNEHYGFLKLDEADKRSVLSFDRARFDVGETDYAVLVILAEMGRISQKKTVDIGASRSFSLIEHSTRWVFGSENHFSSSKCYRLYHKCIIHSRSDSGLGKYIKVSGVSIDISDLLGSPSKDSINLEQPGSPFRVRIPAWWVMAGGILEKYSIRVPNGEVFDVNPFMHSTIQRSGDGTQVDIIVPYSMAKRLLLHHGCLYISGRPPQEGVSRDGEDLWT